MNLRGEVETLFDRLADLNAQRRDQYFSEHPVSLEIRREVKALLASDVTTDRLGPLVGHQALTALDRGGEAPLPETCGPYRMLKLMAAEVWAKSGLPSEQIVS